MTAIHTHRIHSSYSSRVASHGICSRIIWSQDHSRQANDITANDMGNPRQLRHHHCRSRKWLYQLCCVTPVVTAAKCAPQASIAVTRSSLASLWFPRSADDARRSLRAHTAQAADTHTSESVRPTCHANGLKSVSTLTSNMMSAGVGGEAERKPILRATLPVAHV